mmetsp:Transcript_6214/g.18470  ORF Transcript_6214/g.18470 Transcript_6214/m.18470 type:complete len:231 (-) Transcript_6214:1681-2373(-)
MRCTRGWAPSRASACQTCSPPLLRQTRRSAGTSSETRAWRTRSCTPPAPPACPRASCTQMVCGWPTCRATKARRWASRTCRWPSSPTGTRCTPRCGTAAAWASRRRGRAATPRRSSATCSPCGPPCSRACPPSGSTWPRRAAWCKTGSLPSWAGGRACCAAARAQSRRRSRGTSGRAGSARASPCSSWSCTVAPSVATSPLIANCCRTSSGDCCRSKATVRRRLAWVSLS